MKYSSILVISDMHMPYHHPDLVAYLKFIKTKYSPDRIVCIGDEVDQHSISFHTHNSDLFSHGAELKAVLRQIKHIYKLFPEVDVLDSNHGSLVYRRAEACGLSRDVIKSYNAILEAPKLWRWHHDLILTASNGQKIYFHHARSSNVLKSSQQLSMNSVFGHHHNKFSIEHWNNGLERRWGMFVGCLIDFKSLAFAYGRNNLTQPIIGCGIIINGEPKLLPMHFDKRGRWTGELC